MYWAGGPGGPGGPDRLCARAQTSPRVGGRKNECSSTETFVFGLFFLFFTKVLGRFLFVPLFFS